MNQAPSVFVPSTPEGDGLLLPTILSVLVHGLLIGFVLYTHHINPLDPPASIETTMVSPEQLAEIQGQILANRQAAMAATQTNADGSIDFSAASNEDASLTSGSTAATRVPVFIPSNDPAASNDDGILFDREQQRKIQAANEDYQRRMAELAEQIDRESMADLKAIKEHEIERAKIEQTRLEALKQIEQQAPTLKRSQQDDKKTLQQPGRANPGKNDSRAGADSAPPGNPTANPGKGISNGEVVSRIRKNYAPPAAAQGSTQRATLTITVNANGDVVSVSSSGNNEAVNKAAEEAVWQTGNFPIDADDPKYPTFTVVFKGQN